MRPNRYTIISTILLILSLYSKTVGAQLGFPLEIKKSAEYEDRMLRSEKSDQGKFGLPKRFIQNTVTHYNYFFNANNKLNEVLERAKTAFTDDYSQLLPFYNYSLDVTARDSIQLDSIVYKASTGIALHDLRNDWIDNLYLLWGASYYLQKKFDSAYMMFQFINYAFAPKEKDGYYITIGSRMDGNSAYSIATKEKKGLPRKIFSKPPSRNEAFIWQIRNFLVQDQLAEAASLIITLRNDPQFPKRLLTDLHEVQAFWFYKQNIWDSASAHLVKALDNATNLQERSRWEYLAAQLFEMTGKDSEAEKYYSKVSNHTTDLILDIYARLAAVRVNKKGGENSIEKNVAELLRMAKRDKYEEYRDIIYYMAAQMQLEGKNTDEALALLKKSTEFASNNPAQRNKAFLQLAEISYNNADYRKAHDYYDSLRLDDTSLRNTELITARKTVLKQVVNNLVIAERIDSLQRVALLPEEERKDFIKKLVKEIRRQQGLKEEPVTAGPAISIPTLFPSVQPKGEWYFYNAAFRSKGQSDFKARWGNRANVDNWRRSSGSNNTVSNQPDPTGNNPANTSASESGVTYEDLLAHLPLTPEQMQKANDSLQTAWFELGKTYIQEIENCAMGTDILSKLLNRFPQFPKMDEVVFNLYFCYNKTGNQAKASEMKKLLAEKYSSSNFNSIVSTGRNPEITLQDEATKTYEQIYDLFLEGKFDMAVLLKGRADSKFGKMYWTPQLLYIEAVFYIKTRVDSTAKKILNTLIADFSPSPLAEKAVQLLKVLERRDQIESELTRLVVTRKTDDAPVQAIPVVVPESKPDNSNRPVSTTENPKPAENTVQPATNNPIPISDSSKTNPSMTGAGTYRFDANEEHFVGIVLHKIDPVFVNEARNAFNRYNRDNYPTRNLQSQLVEIDTENKILALSMFKDVADAMKYVDATKPRTGSEILPWLKGGKYSFIIMLNSNFKLIREKKDIEGYKSFLNQHLPGKF